MMATAWRVIACSWASSWGVEAGPDQPLEVRPAVGDPFQLGRLDVRLGGIALPQGPDPLVDRRQDLGSEPRLQLHPVGVALEQQQLQGGLGGVVESCTGTS
jgi:hypothetical protein